MCILDDGTISCDVLIFVLSNDDRHSTTNILLNRIRRSCLRFYHADNRSILLVLLQVRPNLKCYFFNYANAIIEQNNIDLNVMNIFDWEKEHAL